MSDVPQIPDYDLEPSIMATTATQMKALSDPIRQTILTLVMDRAATTSELSEALGRPKGTVDHHLKVLANAGYVRVVRTRKVRAMTERFWGRTARTIFFEGPGVEDMSTPAGFIRQALEEAERIPRPTAERPGRDAGSSSGTVEGTDHEKGHGMTTLRHARIPAGRVDEFAARLETLSEEFMATPRGGDTVFGLLIALYPTDQPTLPVSS